MQSLAWQEDRHRANNSVVYVEETWEVLRGLSTSSVLHLLLRECIVLIEEFKKKKPLA